MIGSSGIICNSIGGYSPPLYCLRFQTSSGSPGFPHRQIGNLLNRREKSFLIHCHRTLRDYRDACTGDLNNTQ